MSVSALLPELQQNLPLITYQLQQLQQQATQDNDPLTGHTTADLPAPSADELAQLRSELTANIEVAARVEQRLQAFDQDLKHGSRVSDS